ncbi:hypothetical protein AMQ28_04365 [Acinetobacter sp. TTH0-4]|uniref:hypothetical protein n=1 Tax=Acinetobacter sp. TTH0-4 TaxID=1646498 RepID=UPI0006AEF9DF|nr:hypothetical protein [Acinetobacter sp. TTH0-4]ALD01660.1 hypothetical protein AMQ28_04365 [Acinetobacter sp. TTH0-4]
MTEKEKTNQVDIEDEIHALKHAKITAIHDLAKSQQNTMVKIANLCDLLADLSDSISENANDEQTQHLMKIKQYLDDWFAKERETNANRFYDFKVDTTPGLVRGDIDGTKQ